MIRIVYILLLNFLIILPVAADQLDSLKNQLNSEQNVQEKILILNQLFLITEFSDTASARLYATKAYQLSLQGDFFMERIDALIHLGYYS